MFKKIIWFLMCLSLACSGTSKKQPEKIVPDILPTEIEGALTIASQIDVAKFISKLAVPTEKRNNNVKTVKTFICQPVIDENGQIVDLLIHQRVNPQIDSILVSSINASEFNVFENAQTGQKEKYALFLYIYVTDHYFIYPYKLSKQDVLPEIKVPKKERNVFEAYDTAPEPIGGFGAIQRNLKYPGLARKAGVEGRVILNVLVNQDGDVEKCVILKSMTWLLNNAAIEAVLSVKWKPAAKKGEPVKVWVGIPIIFKLK